MTSLVTGLFRTLGDAHTAAEALLAGGTPAEALGLIARPAQSAAEVGVVPGTMNTDFHDALALLTERLDASLGLRRAEASGLLLAGAFRGAAKVDDIADLPDLLEQVGVSRGEAVCYREALEGGATLLMAASEQDMAPQLSDTMRRCSAIGTDVRHLGDAEMDDQERAAALFARSSKVGTASGALTGAAAGAVLGSVGGPAGAIIGGMVGAAAGATLGAAADTAGESMIPGEDYVSPANDYRHEGEPVYRADDRGARERDFQQHFERHFASSNLAFNQLLVGYRYGYDLGREPRYAGREWLEIEPEIQATWEAERPENAWYRYQAAVLYGWERVRRALRLFPAETGHTTTPVGAPQAEREDAGDHTEPSRGRRKPEAQP